MRSLVTGLLAVSIVVGTAPLVSGQSLADIARKEEERRKAVQTGEKPKVYTNKDLEPAPPVYSTPPPAEAAKTPGAADAAAAKPPEAAKPGEAAKEPPAAPAGGKEGTKPEAAAGEKPEPAKDQAYWSGRMKALRTQLERDQVYAAALQTRINSLTADFTARDDPAQRSVIGADRQKAIDELARLKEQIENGRKAIGDLEEEARRARVPAGWLR